MQDALVWGGQLLAQDAVPASTSRGGDGQLQPFLIHARKAARTARRERAILSLEAQPCMH